jgi:hypothetical protein
MRHSPNRVVALAVGVVFAAFGLGSIVLGVLVGAYLGGPGVLLVAVFGSNVLFGIVTLGAGVALVIAATRGIAAAKAANVVAGTAWLLLGLAGLFFVGTRIDVFAMNGADNALLFAASSIQLAVGLGARHDVAHANPAHPDPAQ